MNTCTTCAARDVCPPRARADRWQDTLSWDVVVEHMDDAIREQVHMELAPCSRCEYLERYAELHHAMLGEPFRLP